MRNVTAIAQRELRAYFVSPLAYVVIAFFLLLSGYLFALITTQTREASLSSLMQNLSVLFLFIVPAISMRLLAEEQRSGTVELLLTNPVQEWEIVVGKYLASLLLVAVMLGLTLWYPALLYAFGNPETGPIVAGYLGSFLLAGTFLSVGLWASSMTQNQIIAAIIAFGMLLILWLSDALGNFLGGGLGAVVNYLSVLNHAGDFTRGVINTKDVVFYLTVIAAGLALSTLTLQSRRVR